MHGNKFRWVILIGSKYTAQQLGSHPNHTTQAKEEETLEEENCAAEDCSATVLRGREKDPVKGYPGGEGT